MATRRCDVLNIYTINHSFCPLWRSCRTATHRIGGKIFWSTAAWSQNARPGSRTPSRASPCSRFSSRPPRCWRRCWCWGSSRVAASDPSRLRPTIVDLFVSLGSPGRDRRQTRNSSAIRWPAAASAPDAPLMIISKKPNDHRGLSSSVEAAPASAKALSSRPWELQGCERSSFRWARISADSDDQDHRRAPRRLIVWDLKVTRWLTFALHCLIFTHHRDTRPSRRCRHIPGPIPSSDPRRPAA